MERLVGDRLTGAALAACALFILLLAFAPLLAVSRLLSQDTRLTQQLNPLAASSANILNLMVDQETGERGFVATANRALLEPYTTGRERLKAVWGPAEQQASEAGGKAPALLDAVRRSAEDWQTQIGEPEVSLVLAAQQEAAISGETSGRGKALFDQFRQDNLALSSYAATEQAQAAATRDADLTRLRIIEIVLVGLGLAALGLLTYTAARSASAFRNAASAEENAQLYAQADEALRVRDEFLSAVSHDLRTPLTTIRGLTQLLQRQLQRPDVAQAVALERSLTGIDRASRTMGRMIDDLLDISRIEAGRPISLNRQETDLVALVRQVIDEQQPLTPNQKIGLETAAVSLTGMWDPARLERVFVNLLSNAIKYSPGGGDVTVTLLAIPQDGTDEHWAEVRVQDSGLGIPPDDLPHIFDQFHRATNVRNLPGLGIGLAGARQTVERHGGTLEAESEEGKGSLFILRLPCAPTTE
jgi:signal transduction histidine kinase